jgi:hypothetical protein
MKPTSIEAGDRPPALASSMSAGIALASAREAQAKIRFMRSRTRQVMSTSSSPRANWSAQDGQIPWLREGSSCGG